MSSPSAPPDDTEEEERIDEEKETVGVEEEEQEEQENDQEEEGSEDEDHGNSEEEDEEDENEEDEEDSTDVPVILNYDTLRDLPPRITQKQLRRVMETQVDKLKAMTPAQLIAQMDEIGRLHKQCYAAAERFIKEVINKIPEYSPIIKEVGNYNQKSCDKLLQATMEDFKEVGKSLEEREVMVDEMEARMMESVQINFEFTHQISFVASPLTVWRLNACTAVWAGNNEIVNAHKTTKFVIEDPNKKKNVDDEEDEEEEEEEDDEEEEEEADDEEEEEEEHVEGELDCEAIAASERPALKAWVKHVYTAGEEPNKRVVCYVRAPSDCLVQDEDLICSFGYSLAEWPNLPGNAEVIGKFVCIRPRHSKVICILPDEPWIIGMPHNYGKNPTREVVIFSLEGNEFGPSATISALMQQQQLYDDAQGAEGVDVNSASAASLPWMDQTTADVFNEDSRYLEIKVNKLNQMVLAPAARIRRDTLEVGRNGGKISCLIDNRVTLVVPAGALRIACVYSLQVQSINQHHAQLLRDQNLAFMSSFIACSPLVVLSGPKKILFKSASTTLPLTDANPSAQVVIMSSASMPDTFSSIKPTANGDEDDENSDEEDKATRNSSGPLELDPFQRSLLLPKLLAGASSSHAEIALVCAGVEDSRWQIWTDPEVLEQKNTDICVFNYQRLGPKKFMAIKTRTVVDAESLLQMAAVLEKSLSQRMVYIILRQDKQYPGRLCLAICLSKDLDKTLNKLAANGLTEGDKPSGPLFIYERQSFDIEFRGNVRPKKNAQRDSMHLAPDNGHMRIAFNSCLRNEYLVEVEERDASAQVACEKYRGFLEISYQQTVKKLPKGKNLRGAAAKKFIFELETFLLCQLLVKLPKKAAKAPEAIHEPFTFEPNDLVTEAFLEELSKKLSGDTWRKLGQVLNMSRTQLQAIGGRAESSGKSKALTMLNTWMKNLQLKVDRAAELTRGLTTIGRFDLATEIQAPHEDTTLSPTTGGSTTIAGVDEVPSESAT